MNEKDIQKIEQALGLKVPESYAQVVLNYPCPEAEDICQHGLFNDPDLVIHSNVEHRKNGWFGFDWPEKHFAIGDDGCGDTYFMIMDGDERVYFADHEAGPAFWENLEDCCSANSLKEHIDEQMEQEKEFQEEQARKADRKKNKKWWQFWI